MPIGSSTREMLLIMRAKDQASRVVRDVANAFKQSGADMDEAGKKAQAAAQAQMKTGAALMGVGAGMLGAGAAIGSFYAGAAKDAAAYQKQVAGTYTQVTEFKTSMEELGEIGKRVGANVGIPFEQLQPALKTIFSSIDVSLAESEVLLETFAKGAVAGVTDIETSAKSAIAIMNSFKMGTEDLGHIMDVQFKTTQLGVITYEEYANTIGRATASAEKAGGSIEDLSGMMAFLTRNGLSSAMAATSSARAFDLLSNPKFEKNMNALGLTTLDASGNFKPMVQVTDELRGKLEGLNEGDRAAALKALTEGAGGTIQAMRFLNAAVLDGSGQLEQFTNAMYNSDGAMQTAYEKMEETYSIQLQKLKNNWQILRVEVGEKVLPILLKVVDWLTIGIQKFKGLSPGMQDAIIYGGMLASALLVVGGGITVLSGAIVFISGALGVLGISVGTLALGFIGIIAIIAAVAAAGYLIYKNWDLIKAKASDLWQSLKDIWGRIGELWHRFLQGFKDPDAFVGKGFEKFDGIFYKIGQTVGDVVGAIRVTLGYLIGFWDSVLFPAIQRVGFVFQTAFTNIAFIIQAAWVLIQPIVGFIANVFTTLLIPAVMILMTVFTTVFGAIGAVMTWWFSTIVMPFFQAVAGIIWNVVIPAIGLLFDIFNTVFQAIHAVLQVFWTIISVIFQMVIGLIVAALLPVVKDIAATFQFVFDIVMAVLRFAWAVIGPIFRWIGDLIRDHVVPWVQKLGDKWSDFWGSATGKVEAAWSGIKEGIKAGANGAIDMMNGFLRQSGEIINGVIDLYNKVPGAPQVSKVTVPQIPRLHTGGMVSGAGALGTGEVLRILQVGEGVLNRRAMAQLGPSGLSALNTGRGAGITIESGAVQLIVQGDVDRETAEELKEAMADLLDDLVTELKAG